MPGRFIQFLFGPILGKARGQAEQQRDGDSQGSFHTEKSKPAGGMGTTMGGASSTLPFRFGSSAFFAVKVPDSLISVIIRGKVSAFPDRVR
jgi:hypothetical protein